MFKAAEHPFNWVARKSHKTHFRDRVSRSTYRPKSNTELLYDGSAEARALLSQSVEVDTVAAGILRHALDYLKGKDVNSLGMWTQDFFDIKDKFEASVEKNRELLERLSDEPSITA